MAEKHSNPFGTLLHDAGEFDREIDSLVGELYLVERELETGEGSGTKRIRSIREHLGWLRDDFNRITMELAFLAGRAPCWLSVGVKD